MNRRDVIKALSAAPLAAWLPANSTPAAHADPLKGLPPVLREIEHRKRATSLRPELRCCVIHGEHGDHPACEAVWTIKTPSVIDIDRLRWPCYVIGCVNDRGYPGIARAGQFRIDGLTTSHDVNGSFFAEWTIAERCDGQPLDTFDAFMTAQGPRRATNRNGESPSPSVDFAGLPGWN